MRPHLAEIVVFARITYLNVLHPILQFRIIFSLRSVSYLLANQVLALRGLGLPEDALVNMHGYSSVGDTYGKTFASSFITSIDDLYIR